MKKIIPIKVQTVFMFIPILNSFALFMWLYNYSRAVTSIKVLLKSVLVMFASLLPIIIIASVLQSSFTMPPIFIHLMTYVASFSVAFGLVQFQKKVFGKNTKDDV